MYSMVYAMILLEYWVQNDSTNDQTYMKQNLVLFSDVGHHPKDNKHGIVFEEVRPLVKEILNYYNVNKSLCSNKTSQTVVTVIQAS